jgi:hypothetical protein
MKRLLVFIFSGLGLSSGLAQTVALQPVGQATGYWAGLIPVYDATLWAQPGTTQTDLLSDQTPLKLELCYRVGLTEKEFIEAADQALPKQLPVALRLATERLHQHYEAVQPKDCYELAYQPETGVQLRLNNKLKYQDRTQGFKAVYFGIWLGDTPLSEAVKTDLTDALPTTSN